MLDFLKRALRNPTPKLYGLDHAVLNIQLPPQTMWMNMGYWEHTDDFPEACEALLDQVLMTALSHETKSIRILDVGCGCGDQSLHILKTLGRQTKSEVTDSQPNLRHRSVNSRSYSLPLLASYVGISLEPAQADLAERRIQQVRNTSVPAKVFCADASVPSEWPAELSTIAKGSSRDLRDETSWLLALDSLYHFRPSRAPLLSHAANLNFSFMAFDLLIREDARWWEKLLLRIICLGTNAPFGNFVTEGEYVNMLVGAGYSRESIEMKDISRFVFEPLARFMGERVQTGRDYGLAVKKYKVAGWVFGWWARGAVRGVVVVARK
ncbi:unnamed protein product [Penicillium olsonii]|nr:unnamed protein product [Penicillium olsonii]CAG7930818.1 unnamed protein product [Penicillium olsonii]